MTPRSKIESLHADDTVADLMDEAMETGYSRFPIVAGDLDETIGIVHVKQVVRRCRSPTGQDQPGCRPGAAGRHRAVHASTATP